MGGFVRTRVTCALAAALCAWLLAVLPAAEAGATESAGPSAAAKAHHRSARVLPAEVALTPSLVAPAGATVEMAPAGLSIEYPVMARDLGSGPCPAPALMAELARLGSPPIELAGVSQDETAPTGALSGTPASWQAATLYQLPAAFWSQLHCLLTAARDPLTVGLNLRTGNLTWASLMAANAQTAAANGLSFSIGDEPDLYGIPNYAALAKPLPGEELAAANLYLQLAEYLKPAVAGAPLMGPELARPVDWRNQLPRVLAQLHYATVGIHAYPLSACRSTRAVTIGGLLSTKSADEPSRLAWVVGDARAAGAPAIISEANSASCGGLAGVSDAPASAVWAVRFVLEALKSGFEEVRFHSAGDPYDPFLVRGGAVLRRPLESALAALNTWLPAGSTFRTVPGVRNLVATAVAEPGGKLLLILDNEGAHAQPVVIRGAGGVNVEALSASIAGLQQLPTSRVHGVVRLSIAKDTVAALSPAG